MPVVVGVTVVLHVCVHQLLVQKAGGRWQASHRHQQQQVRGRSHARLQPRPFLAEATPGCNGQAQGSSLHGPAAALQDAVQHAL